MLSTLYLKTVYMYTAMYSTFLVKTNIEQTLIV